MVVPCRKYYYAIFLFRLRKHHFPQAFLVLLASLGKFALEIQWHIATSCIRRTCRHIYHIGTACHGIKNTGCKGKCSGSLAIKHLHRHQKTVGSNTCYTIVNVSVGTNGNSCYMSSVHSVGRVAIYIAICCKNVVRAYHSAFKQFVVYIKSIINNRHNNLFASFCVFPCFSQIYSINMPAGISAFINIGIFL